MKEYNEEDFLQISGIQHFHFCRRQWALIHIENQWSDNLLTVEGTILHERAHDSGLRESRGELVITRDMAVFSRSLGISGNCDIVEFRQNSEGISLRGKKGLFQPFPVEYKRGKPKEHNADVLQLCAQGMCLEEMLCCSVPKGAVFYAEPHRRLDVEFTEDLRNEMRQHLQEMHDLFSKGYTPRVRPSKSCNACSLKDICLPKLQKKRSVSEYIQSRIDEAMQ